MVPLDVYQKIMDINLFGSIRVIRAALPLIRKANGIAYIVKHCKAIYLFEIIQEGLSQFRQ
jgi:NAD(P)-dependent dehydrogenase (short-subunit alcohol dehydrogenase family)